MYPPALTTTIGLLLLACAGCRSAVPMHVWTPPRLQSAVGSSVALATIVGDPSLATQLGEAITATRPPELSRSVRLVHQAELQRRANIQLASAVENVPSDLALLSAAREQGVEYLLIGEILQRRGEPLRRGSDRLDSTQQRIAEFAAAAPVQSHPPSDAPRDDSPENGRRSLTVSWRLTDVGEARVVGGMPVTVFADSSDPTGDTDQPRAADASGPDATDAQLVRAAAEETWKLLVPHLRRSRVELAEPYLLPGSKRVRSGNAEAKQLRWAEAERVWREVVEDHPWNHAAWHNLALAAAARQDFEQAKSLAQRALRMNPLGRYEPTVVWIEGRQRELVDAFELPAPEDGWLFSPD